HFSLSFSLWPPSPAYLYAPSLHDALPISLGDLGLVRGVGGVPGGVLQHVALDHRGGVGAVVSQTDQRAAHRVAVGLGYHGTHTPDRKSTRLNSSHVSISYAVFCLKKKINT